jgi:hypothetical protein
MINQQKPLPLVLFIGLAALALAACGTRQTTPLVPTTSLPSATSLPPSATATAAPTATSAPTQTPTVEIPPTWSRPKIEYHTPTPTQPISRTVQTTAQPTAGRGPAASTRPIGELTDLGSGSPDSQVVVYIRSGRLRLEADKFAKEATLLVRMRASGGSWSGAGRITIPVQAPFTISLEVPSQLRGQSPLEVCLRNTETNAQNCYSVLNQ